MGVTAMEFDAQGDLYLLIAFNGQLRIGGRSPAQRRRRSGHRGRQAERHGGSPIWLVGWGSSLIDTPGGFTVQAADGGSPPPSRRPVQVASTRLEAGPAIISLDYNGVESTVANVGREFIQLRARSSEYFYYLTKDGRVGLLTPW